MSITIILLLTGICLALTLTAIGAFMIFKKFPFDQITKATVTQVECEKNNKCTTELKFTSVDNKIYIKKAILQAPVKKDDTITIMYDSKNPNVFYPGNPPIRVVGGVIGFTGLALLFGLAIWAFFTFRASTPSVPPPPEPVSLPVPVIPYNSTETTIQTSSTETSQDNTSA